MTGARGDARPGGPARVLVPLLEGFEEIEAITLIDVLRRAEIEVLVAGEDRGPVRGAHDLVVHAELALGEVHADDLTMIVLPGGARASASLAEHARLQELLRKVSGQGGYTCAMCAAPMALAAAGLHVGREVTSHPAFADHMRGARQYSESRVVIDGPVVTSRGPGTAMEFALTLVGLLRGEAVESALESSMLVDRKRRADRSEEETS